MQSQTLATDWDLQAATLSCVMMLCAQQCRGLAKLQLHVASHCKTHLHLPRDNVSCLPGQSDFSVFCTGILEVSVTTVFDNLSGFLPRRLGDFMCQDDPADVTSDFDIQNSLLLSFLKAEVSKLP